MRRQIIILTTVLMVAVGGVCSQEIRRPPCDFSCQMGWTVPTFRRVTPIDPSAYAVPRSVGAWSGAGDMQQAPMRWWSLTNTEPTWVTFERMVSYGLTAVGKFIRAHPTDHRENSENIRKAFRSEGIDIIVFRPELWGSTEIGCNGGGPLRWENYPVELYGWMYETYAHQNKAVFILSLEADLQMYGLGCKERDQCVPEGWYWNDCVAVCEEQTEYDPTWPVGSGWNLPDDYVVPETCREVCCDLDKVGRGDYLLRIFNERQAAAEAARAAHPDAALRVLHTVEVNYFGNQDWQWVTVLADVIPRMDSPPDAIGLSLWPGAGDPLAALHYAMAVTGLPAYRFFISQVGAREGTQPDGRVFVLPHQRERLMAVIPPLFDEGVAFALVWSMEQPEPTGQTGHSCIDVATGGRLSGYAAIEELNEVYR